MEKPKKIAVIGCGGIACCIVPILTRMYDLVLMDEDNYEPKNVSRQFPAMKYTTNKAEGLKEMMEGSSLHKIEAIPKYFKGIQSAGYDEFIGVDFVIACVDNNKSRKLIKDACIELNIPCILGGNEHVWGEAHLMIPGIYDPLEHFEFPDTVPAPWSCNSDQNLDENPQTLIANALASGAALHLLLSFCETNNPINTVVFSKMDVLSNESARVRDLVKQEN